MIIRNSRLRAFSLSAPLAAATFGALVAGCSTATPSAATRFPANSPPAVVSGCNTLTDDDAKRNCVLLEIQTPVTLGVAIAAIDAFLWDEMMRDELGRIDAAAITHHELTSFGKSLVGGLTFSGISTLLGESLNKGTNGGRANPASNVLGVASFAAAVAVATADLKSAEYGTSIGLRAQRTIVEKSARDRVKPQVAPMVALLADLFVLDATKKLLLENKIVDAVLAQASEGKAKDFEFDFLRFMESEGFVEKSRIKAYESVSNMLSESIPGKEPEDAAEFKSAYAQNLKLLQQVHSRLQTVLARVTKDAEKSSSVKKLRDLDVVVAHSIAKVEAHLRMMN